MIVNNMEVMIDIETLSVSKEASIATIAAVKFQRNGSTIEHDSLYLKIDRTSCDQIGLEVSSETVIWWEKQEEIAKEEIFGIEGRIAIREALLTLSKFIDKNSIVWANSPNFDIVILENAYKKCGLLHPWKFWNLRDCRTVYDLGGLSLKEHNKRSNRSTSHNSLQDCMDQISCLQHALKKLTLF